MGRAPVFLSGPHPLNARIFKHLPQRGFLLGNAAVVGQLQIQVAARPAGTVLLLPLAQESLAQAVGID